MKMVLLAAGHGRRFGGLKQLAPIGPHGEALIDFTVRHAEDAGFDGVVLVVREEIRDEMLAHAAAYWPASLPVSAVVQGKTPGTVPAVLAAAGEIDGPFAVANADDLYGEAAFHSIAAHFASESPCHVLIGYRLRNTVLTAQPVKRGLCVVDERHELADLVEHHVCARPDGAFDAVPLELHADRGDKDARLLDGNEAVSMNLWGFHPHILEEFAAATETHILGGEPDAPGELLLPEVVGRLVRSGEERVRVVETASRCIGITHRDDVALVQRALDGLEPATAALEAAGFAAAPGRATAERGFTAL